jgi:hypothetical protein
MALTSGAYTGAGIPGSGGLVASQVGTEDVVPIQSASRVPSLLLPYAIYFRARERCSNPCSLPGSWGCEPTEQQVELYWEYIVELACGSVPGTEAEVNLNWETCQVEWHCAPA